MKFDILETSLGDEMTDLKRLAYHGISKKAGVLLFHISPYKFSRFSQQYRSSKGASDFGFHFGSIQTVTAHLHALKKKGNLQGKRAYLYTVNVTANNPLLLQENRIGGWAVHRILGQIFDDMPSWVTDKMLDDYEDGIVTLPNGENILESFSEQAQMDGLALWLESFGFDSIKYRNTFEGGGMSYIVFHPNQARIVNIKEINL